MSNIPIEDKVVLGLRIEQLKPTTAYPFANTPWSEIRPILNKLLAEDKKKEKEEKFNKQQAEINKAMLDMQLASSQRQMDMQARQQQMDLSLNQYYGMQNTPLDSYVKDVFGVNTLKPGYPALYPTVAKKPKLKKGPIYSDGYLTGQKIGYKTVYE